MKVENDGNSAGTSGASYADASDGLWVDTRWNTATNTPFKVTSNSGTAPMMIIKGDGKVGIGKTPSTWHLDVDSPNIYIASFDGSNDKGIVINSMTGEASIVGYSNSANAYNKVNIRGAGGTGLVVDTSNNVGIGTTVPNAKLDVHLAQQTGTSALSASSYAHFGSQSHTNAAIMGLTLGYKEANLLYRKIGLVAEGLGDNAARQNFHILVNTVDEAASVKLSDSKFMIDGVTGNIGIGETNPDTTLHIKKNQSSANSSIKLENAAGGNDSSFSIDWQLASSGTSAQIKAIRTNSPGAGDTDLVFSSSTSGTSLAEQMRIDHEGNITAKKIDVIATGGRISAYVQDMFHVGGEKSANTRYGFSSSRTYADGGSSNYQGYVFGSENYIPAVFIPYSPHQVYRISASIHQLTNGTGYDHSKHYMGLAGYDENFNFLSVDGIGTYQYNLASNTVLSAGGTLEVDVTLKGWQGSGGSNGNKMDEGTVYIRPLILFNYQRGGGTTVLTGFNIQPAGTIADNDSNAGTNY
jgi:hypothetical protein